MGFKCYRLSIAWTRIFPNGDDAQPNAAGIAFYRSVFEECRKYGIEPLVTICHFDTPIALIKKYGGWKDRRMIDAFVRYCEVLFDNFGGALCVLPGGFWTNRLKNSKIRSECARMLDSIL